MDAEMPADDSDRDFTSTVDMSPTTKSLPVGTEAAGEAYYEEEDYRDDRAYEPYEIYEPTRSELRNQKREARELRRDVRKAERQAARERKRPIEGASPRPIDEDEYLHEEMEYPPPQDPILIVEEPNYPPAGQGWGDATYLSNDDTMSLSSAQRTIYAIEHYEPLLAQHIRPHELMNYFTFETAPVGQGRDFSVRMELDPEADASGTHGLAVSVQGRRVTRSTRRNANITMVVDRSGSMREEGRMNYLKRGLHRMTEELRDGDIINLVSFDHRVCVPIRNFVVGRDNPKMLDRAIDGLRPSGNTNLFAGLSKGYELADANYRDGYTNRVVMVTDALANQGETDTRVMAMAADWYDSRRIRLSGIGVGRNFNDHLLDRMTEKGRGAYVFLGSEAEVDAVFGRHFVSMIETTANDVHFRLHLPPSLRMKQFHGEESSTSKSEVQAIHYFANTSQLFLADLEAWEGDLRRQDEIMLEIEYMDPESGEVLREDYAFRVAEVAERGKNLEKSQLVKYWIDGVSQIAARSLPAGWRARAYGWEDPHAWELCQRGDVELDRMAEGLDGDREVVNVLRLWQKQCERFAKPRKPGRKYEGDPGWPAARG
jgi:Ca-activated chloride channel family protein